MADEIQKFSVEDDDGNTIETVPASVLEQKEKEASELREKLRVQEEKERNWKAVNEKAKKAEEEKERAATDNQTLAEKIRALEEERANEKQAQVESRKQNLEKAIKARANGNKELEEKMLFLNSRFAGEPLTDDEFSERIDNVATLAKAPTQSSNSFNRAASASGSSYVPQKEAEDFSMTPEGIETAKALGLKYVNNIK